MFKSFVVIMLTLLNLMLLMQTCSMARRSVR